MTSAVNETDSVAPIEQDDSPASWRYRGLAALAHPLFHAGIVIAIVAVGQSRRIGTAGPGRRAIKPPTTPSSPATPRRSLPKSRDWVRSVAVDDYQLVRAGDLIAEIEPADYGMGWVEMSERELRRAEVLASVMSLSNSPCRTTTRGLFWTRRR